MSTTFSFFIGTPCQVRYTDPFRKKAKNLMANSKSFKFEHALTELTSIVDAMESNDLSLEKALIQFERGVKLTRECQKAITNAQQKVQILVNETELQPFDNTDDE